MSSDTTGVVSEVKKVGKEFIECYTNKIVIMIPHSPNHKLILCK